MLDRQISWMHSLKVLSLQTYWEIDLGFSFFRQMQPLYTSILIRWDGGITHIPKPWKREVKSQTRKQNKYTVVIVNSILMFFSSFPFFFFFTNSFKAFTVSWTIATRLETSILLFTRFTLVCFILIINIGDWTLLEQKVLLGDVCVDLNTKLGLHLSVESTCDRISAALTIYLNFGSFCYCCYRHTDILQ